MIFPSMFHAVGSGIAAGPWYVDTGGNDSATCLSPTAACLTINGAVGKASPGDLIYVASGTYTDLGSAVVAVDKNISLTGGWNASFTDQNGTSIIDGQSVRRGVNVIQGVTAVVERFTIENGEGDSAGGIWNDGQLTLLDSTVRDNLDSGDWTSEGGGIRNSDQGTLIVNNSTISGNESSSGAGIFNAWGTIIVNNSTISGNSARGFGGGINNLGGAAYLNNVTITDNIDDDNVAGGIHNEGGGSVYIQNSIIAKNNGDGPDCNGSLTSSGYNLIGNASGCSLSPADGDLTGMDPKLASLADNGGPTATHALQFGSAATNTGNPGGCKDHLTNPLDLDQRGFGRVQRCDIGAFEFQTEIRQLYLPLLYRPLGHADNFNDNSLDLEYWTVYNDEPGIILQESGGEIKISGTSQDSSWGWTGVGSPVFPKQDFDVSVDYKLLNMTDDRQRAGIRLLFNGGVHDLRVGYWDLDDIYYMGYRDDGGYHHISGIPALGDEGSTYHTLRIEFDAAANTARGYVDQFLIGSLNSGIFTSPLSVAFEQSAQIPGSFNVDCRYDNFKLIAK